MTAVEWLVDQYQKSFTLKINEVMTTIIEQSKEMEKQQIINARLSLDNSIHFEDALESAEQYYNETFKQ